MWRHTDPRADDATGAETGRAHEGSCAGRTDEGARACQHSCPGEKPDPAETLVVGVSGDMTGWEPATSVYALANEIIINTHEQLIDVDKATDESGNPVHDNAKFIPRLAESWAVSSGRQDLHVQAAKGRQFNNGDPFNAQAVKASFEYYLGIASSQSRLKNIVAITDTKQITVVDEYTVSFTLETPNALFLKAFTKPNYVIVNAKQILAWARPPKNSKNGRPSTSPVPAPTLWRSSSPESS